MGLLDVLNGMRNGPGGQRSPSSSGGGMSPITMAILAWLAYKGVKHMSGQRQAAPAAPGGQAGGGLGDVLGGLLGGAGGAGPSLGGLLQGGLGGLLAGGAAGSVLSGGLGSLIKDLQQNGHSAAANSWVGTGPNEEISESALAHTLGADAIRSGGMRTI